MLIEIEMKAHGDSETKVTPIRNIYVSAALTGRSGSMQSKPRPKLPEESK